MAAQAHNAIASRRPTTSAYAHLSIADLSVLYDAYRAAAHGYLLIINMPKCSKATEKMIDVALERCYGESEAVEREIKARTPHTEREHYMRMRVLMASALDDSLYEIERVVREELPTAVCPVNTLAS